MKRVYIIAAVTAMFFACGINSLAYDEDAPREASAEYIEGVTTVITDNEGVSRTVDGWVNDTELPDGTAEYEVFKDGMSVMRVMRGETADSDNVRLFDDSDYAIKYDAIDFIYSDTERILLTGLSPSNSAEIKSALYSAVLEGSSFSFESVDFIDAEKTNSVSQGDSNLCWAASVSDMIMYSGWAAKAGFANEDDIFYAFNEEFTDFESNQSNGIDWFFNRVNPAQGKEGWAQVKRYGKSGGYGELRRYSSEMIKRRIPVEFNHTNFRSMTELMKQGWAAGIVLGWIDGNGVRNGGHSITLWGYMYDVKFEQGSDSIDNIKAIIISDSDDDRTNEDRHLSPNKMQVLNMTPYYEGGRDTWSFDNYGGVLEEFIMLAPCGGYTEYETNEYAMMDSVSSPDFMVDSVTVSTDINDNNVRGELFSEGDVIYIKPHAVNYSSVPYKGRLSYSVTANSDVYTTECEVKAGPFEVFELAPTEIQAVKGNYTLQVQLNNDGYTSESFFYNNYSVFNYAVVEDKPDLSYTYVNANVTEIGGGELKAELRYYGAGLLSAYLNGKSYECTVLTSYYENGGWSRWMYATPDETEADDNTHMTFTSNELCRECCIKARGEKTKFRVIIEMDNLPDINLYTEEYDLRYTELSVAVSDDNTGEYTPIDIGANTLSNGEQFAFTIENTSQYDNGSVSCSLKVYAVNEATKEITVLYQKDDVSAVYGSEPETVTVDEWDISKTLAGTYDVYAGVESKFGESETKLGVIKVREAPSLVITSSGDKEDEYDGLTSIREAVKYAGEDDVISVDSSVEMITLTEPLVIDKTVAIDCLYSGDGDDYGQTVEIPLGTAIHADNKNQVFIVEENGELNLSHAALMRGYSVDYGGAIRNNGGVVNLNECRLYSNTSAVSGGGIYAQSGTVNLRGCSFRANKSSDGSAVGVGADASVNMINCTFTQNTSSRGTITNHGGSLTAVFSTFVENTAQRAYGSAVTSDAGSKSYVIGCIAPDDKSFSRSEEIYGSYISTRDSAGAVDCEIGNRDSMFKTLSDGSVDWINEGQYRCLHYLPHLSSEVRNGIRITVIDGNIAYYKEGAIKSTSILSPFAENEYKTDALNTRRAAFYGSYALTDEETEISYRNGGAIVYSPTEQNAAVIVAVYNEDGTLAGIVSKDVKLRIGTSSLSIDTSSMYDGCSMKLMVWDSVSGMKAAAYAAMLR